MRADGDSRAPNPAHVASAKLPALRPQIRYAKSGPLNIAYSVAGDAEIDLVIVPGFISHVEVVAENPHIAKLTERTMRFARVITFDKRGTGMSDPVATAPP